MSTFTQEIQHISMCPYTLLMYTSVLSLLTLTPNEAATVSSQSGPASQCETIQVPMCKGLVKYNSTKLPNRFGHQTQTEVYWALQPWWPFMDAGCSDNLRDFLCGLYLPKCMGDEALPHYPCQETCKKAKVRCVKQMRRQNMRWSPKFRCGHLVPKKSKKCIKPQREKKKGKNREYVLCEPNRLTMCKGIPFSQGSLPNMFLQGDGAQIDREMQQFQPLIDSGCSNKLRLFLCGVYMPFCVPGSKENEAGGVANEVVMNSQPDVPFVVPCRELCQEVYDQCSGEYSQRTHGLPWPGKFHCHRYPSYINSYDNSNNNDNSNNASRIETNVPCTMTPYNYDGN